MVTVTPPPPHSNADLRWQFIQAPDSTWRWRRAANGDGPSVSPPFNNFGHCISDAIKHGFRPDMHPYSTRSSAGASTTNIEWSHGTQR